MDTRSAARPVPASEFARKFGQYRVKAQREAVAVSSHGELAGYFIAPEDYEDYVRMKSARRSFATEQLDDETVRAIGRARMAPRHKALNSLLRKK